MYKEYVTFMLHLKRPRSAASYARTANVRTCTSPLKTGATWESRLIASRHARCKADGEVTGAQEINL